MVLVPCDPSGSGSGSDPGSGKTAIVPVNWTGVKEFVKLWATEDGDPRFTDTFEVDLTGRASEFEVDIRYLSVCESGTIRALCCLPQDRAVKIAASYEDGKLKVRQGYFFAGAKKAMVQLTGIRYGFMGRRYERASDEEFDQNERRLNVTIGDDGRVTNGKVKKSGPSTNGSWGGRFMESEAARLLRKRKES